MNVRIVIPSRKRVGDVRTLNLFPDATLVVCPEEEDAYREAYPNNEIVVHPDGVTMMSPLRQWILDHFPEEALFQANDDIRHFTGITDGSYRDYGAAEARVVVENTAQMAKDVGASVFGFNQARDVRKFTPCSPFSMCTWVGGAIGFIGRKHRYDQNLLLRADIDFCLTCLRYDRIIWTDQRYAFDEVRFKGAGGNSQNRTKERHEKEIAYLKAKWGSWLRVQKKKEVTRLIVNVER